MRKETEPRKTDPVSANIFHDENRARNIKYKRENTAPLFLHQVHSDFGNTDVLSALSGESSSLDQYIHGMMTMESTGANLGSQDCGFMGNHEIMRMIHRKNLYGNNEKEQFPSSTDPRIQNISTSGGLPLVSELRAHMERIFSHDFQHVRIHTSAQDSASAEALNAHAFTVGSHIYFSTGLFQPSTTSGMELLAHELTHVVQHDEGRIPSSSGAYSVSSPTDPFEVEAYKMGAKVAHEYGGFSSSQPVSTIDSLFEEKASMPVQEHFMHRIDASEEFYPSSEVTVDSSSASSMIAREEQGEDDSGKTEEGNGLPETIEISIIPVGSVTAEQENGGMTYAITGSLADLELPEKITLTEGPDGWTAPLTYRIKTSDSFVYAYDAPNDQRGTLNVSKSGKGSVELNTPEDLVVKLGAIGEAKFTQIKYDSSGLSGVGKFTPSEKSFAYLQKIVPGAKIEDSTIEVKRTNGTWGASGGFEMAIKAGELDIFKVTTAIEGSGDNTQYKMNGTLALNEGASNNATVAGTLTPKSLNTGDFALEGTIAANSLKPANAKTLQDANLETTNLQGSLTVGYSNIKQGEDPAAGFFAKGEVSMEWKIPAASRTWKFVAGPSISQGDGLILSGSVTGEQELDSEALSSLRGGQDQRKMSISGSAEYDLGKGNVKKAELGVQVNLTSNISGAGTVKYDGEKGEWDTGIKIEGDFRIPGMNEAKSIPEKPINLGDYLPPVVYPIAPPLVGKIFIDGTAGLKVGPPKFTLGIDLGLNFNSKDELVSRAFITGSGEFSAKAEADANINGAAALSAGIAELGFGAYGGVAAEANMNTSLKVNVDLLGTEGNNEALRQCIPDQGTAVNALGEIKLDAKLMGKVGVFAYVDTAITDMSKYSHELGSIDIATWGPVQSTWALTWAEETGFDDYPTSPTGWDNVDFSPLKKKVLGGFYYLKEKLGLSEEGTAIEASVTNKNVTDGVGGTELYLYVNNQSSDDVTINKGQTATISMNVEGEIGESMDVVVYEDDLGFDDELYSLTWEQPYGARTGSNDSVQISLKSLSEEGSET